MIMKSKFLTVILIAALVFSLSFAVSAQEEEKTIRVSWWGSQTRHDQTLKIIEMFEEKYPNINVEPEYTGWSGYWDKLFAQAAGDNLPDVLQHVRKYFGTWVEEGRLMDLEPYVNDGTLNTDNISDEMLDLGRYKGKLVGMPLGVNAITTIYNPDLLEKAGLDRKIDPDWTWQDMMEMSKQINDELKIYSTIGLLKDDLGHFQIWLRQNGASLYNDAGTGLGYEDDQLFVKFFKMEKELLDYGAVAPLGLRRELVHTVEEDPVTDGTAAMSTQRWSNQFVAISQSAGDFGKNFKMTTVPSKEGGEKGLFVKASQHFAVSDNTEHPEAAMKFINFFTHNVEAQKVMMGERGVPISSKIQEKLAPELNETQQKVFDYLKLAQKHAGPARKSMPPGHEQVADLFQDTFYNVLYGEYTMEEGADHFRTEVEKILSK